MRHDHREPVNKKRQRALMVDPLLVSLKDSTPEELDAWVEANVQSMGDVKFVLKKLAQVVNFLYHQHT